MSDTAMQFHCLQTCGSIYCCRMTGLNWNFITASRIISTVKPAGTSSPSSTLIASNNCTVNTSHNMWCSYSSAAEDSSIVGSHTVSFSEWLLMFWRNTVLSASEVPHSLKMSRIDHKTTLRYIPTNLNPLTCKLPMRLHKNCAFNSAFTVAQNQQPLKVQTINSRNI